MISELAKSSTIMNIETTDLKEADGNTRAISCYDSRHQTNSTKHKSAVDGSDSNCCTNMNQITNDQYYDKDCSECQIVRRDPTAKELTMCLHALSYKVSCTQLKYIQWNPVDTKGTCQMSVLSGCPYEAGYRIKSYGHMFYR